MLEPFLFDASSFRILDQTALPRETRYIPLSGAEDAWHAIREMKVRGAPAIALTAILALAHEARSTHFDAQTREDWILALEKRCQHLETSRPTAVNMHQALHRVLASMNQLPADAAPQSASAQLHALALQLLQEDKETNQKIGDNGARWVQQVLAKQGKSGPVRVLTHCNTGSLATAGYGTALGTIRSLQRNGHLERAYATETRPYLQGSRLTLFELLYEKIPATLICDSMAGLAMQRGMIDAVIVGADRVARNGDTANKIGTYALSVLAAHHSIPFFVAAPWTTIDVKCPDGSHIPIEERPAHELTQINGVAVAPEGATVWNPSFDLTPSNLIAAIFTEQGVLLPHSNSTDYRLDAPRYVP
jgi:methylthioribose-1-phosphate isomerase